jgi:FMN phosphatase YigB (HAD superfamily)
MPPRFIDKFNVILLDMVRTFMFNADRFSAADDFAATYQWIGGRTLSDGEVRQIISSVFGTMLTDSLNPQCHDRFPSVLSYLETLPLSKELPQYELGLLEHVFALHEIGEIPDAHTTALRRLRETHKLGVVSDIWSRSDLYLQEFERAGVRELFDVIVFSSDYGHLKPSRYLFTKAIEAFAVERAKIVFVGDSLRCDIAGAKAVGLSAIWINADRETVEESVPSPDLEIRDLRELLEL